jgi:hypothetical protein
VSAAKNRKARRPSQNFSTGAEIPVVRRKVKPRCAICGKRDDRPVFVWFQLLMKADKRGFHVHRECIAGHERALLDRAIDLILRPDNRSERKRNKRQ